MATLTISKVSVCPGGNHFTLRFAIGAQSVDVSSSIEEISNMGVDVPHVEATLKGLLAIFLRIYTPAQVAQKINAGISITL